MVKPLRTLSLLTAIFIFLSFISILLPEEIILAENQKFYIPQLAPLFISAKDTSLYADISDIRKKYENKKNTKKFSEGQVKVEKQNKEELEDSRRIQYPPDQDTVLYAFLRSLKNIYAEKKLVRVLHYGDSQLEGDRITASLRNKFQAEFGGCGTGIIPIINIPNTPSIFQSTQGNWDRYAMYGSHYNSRKGSYYGLMGTFFKYQEEGASVRFSQSPYSNELQKTVQNIKLLYRNPKESFFVDFELNGKWNLRKKVPVSTQFNFIQYDLEENFKWLDIRFEDSESPEIYGVAFDCDQGIAFDNIPLRGSSGTEFTRINQIHFENQIKKMNVKLIILQFGVNIVPYIEQDYDFYEEQLYQELNYLKSLSDITSILVVGVSDVSKKVNGTYVSYPNLEKIRDAQRNAAFRAGCAFWDLYESMGGKNSMPSWVFANPPLANQDFIHFTNKGADIIAEMLYKAVINEYDSYLLKNSPKN